MSKYTFLLIYMVVAGEFSLLSYLYILLSFLVIKMWFSFMEKVYRHRNDSFIIIIKK